MAAAAELSGVGVGWRPEIAGVVADMSGFTEVIAESLAPAAPPRGVAELRERGVRVVPHGVRLSLGGTDPLDRDRVTHLAACAAALVAPLVSEHVAFVRAGGRDAGHLLPLPRSREALDVLARNVARLQAELDVPLALEPIAALLDWPDDEFTEGEFLTRLLDRTGARLLLDVANVYANAVNRGRDPEAVLDTFPLDRIAYVHIAGGDRRGGLYHDTHMAPVPDEVLALLTALVDRTAHTPAVMLERDGRYPPAAAVAAELAAIHAATTTHRGSPTPRIRDAGTPNPRIEPPAPLACGQSALVAALVAGGDRPAGFDPARVDATRRALLRKRAGQAATVWPLLAASLGDGWAAAFAEHHDGHEPRGALRDGWDLARALRDRGDPGGLGTAAAGELAAWERAMVYDGVRPPRARLRTRIAGLLRG